MECISCGAELESDQDELCPDCESAGIDGDSDSEEDEDDDMDEEDEE
ncbi:MAG: hypothetical protein ABIJ46_02355 [bacterium]